MESQEIFVVLGGNDVDNDSWVVGAFTTSDLAEESLKIAEEQSCDGDYFWWETTILDAR